MKRFFTVICFIFISLMLHAQMAMEEIAYVPAPSGYYNNLVVKGDVTINELVTESFFIRAYSSLLKLSTKNIDTTFFYIRDVEIYHDNAVAVMKESILDNGSFNTHIAEPNSDDRASDTESENIIFYMNGGQVSATRLMNDHDSSFNFTINNVYSSSSVPVINVTANNMSSTSTEDVRTKGLTIFGMDVPPCPNNYYWQKVKLPSGAVYTVLACNPTVCANPEQEEQCVGQTGYCWNPLTCQCAECL